MGLKEDIKLQKERLRVENEIANRIERQTKSLSSWREGVKEVRENAKQIKRLDEDILDIEKAIAKEKKKGNQADEKAIKLAEEHKAKLEQQRAQIVATNKELANANTLMKAMGNSMISAFKGMIPSLSDVINKVLELDDITRQTAANIGLSGEGFKAFEASTRAGREAASYWAFAMEDVVKMAGQYADATGRQVILSQKASEKMMDVARATGLSLEEMGDLTGEMEAFGLGANQSAQMIADIQAESEQMGANAGKVIKKFQQNLQLLNKMNFRGGVDALKKLAIHSEKFKLSMEAISSVSEKVFRPEGAIDAAAHLQMMGGSLAQLGDPFQLMYQARNAPEELAKSLTKAAKESAVFNEKTGQFEVNAQELERLRESAKALGMDYTELVQTAKQAAKIDMMERFLPSGMNEEDKAVLTGMSQMTKDGAEITFVDKAGELKTKMLKNLTQAERQQILQRAKSDKERAEQAMGAAKQWEAIQQSLLLVAVEILQPFVDWLNGPGKAYVNSLKEGILGVARWIKNIVPELKKWAVWVGDNWGKLLTGALITIGLFKAGQWVLNGMALGKGFNMTARTGGSGGTPVKTKGAGKGLGGLGAGLKSFGMAMKNPAMILAIAGALWILADAIEKLAGIPWPQLVLATAILIALGVGLYLFMNAISTMAMNPYVWLAVVLLLAIGAAMMMLGAAVYFIASGIALVVDSFTNMFSVVNTDQYTTFDAAEILVLY